MASCAMNLRTISFLADLHKPQYLPVARLCIYIQYSKPVFREHSGPLKNRISWRDQGMLSFMVDALNNKKKKIRLGFGVGLTGVTSYQMSGLMSCEDHSNIPGLLRY